MCHQCCNLNWCDLGSDWVFSIGCALSGKVIDQHPYLNHNDCIAIVLQVVILKFLESELKMASITIRNLDEDVKSRLRLRAAEHSRSMEEEVRTILREAVGRKKRVPRNLAEFTRECFAPLGGVSLELPAREPMRKPPDFS